MPELARALWLLRAPIAFKLPILHELHVGTMRGSLTGDIVDDGQLLLWLKRWLNFPELTEDNNTETCFRRVVWPSTAQK